MLGGNGKSHAATLDAHTPEAVSARLRAVPDHRYLRDFVYGAVDGTVTTFAVVSGVAGANLPGRIVLILGIANVVADGFSMAAGNFLGTRAESQLAHRARQMEERHVDDVPLGEREEVRQIYAAKGFTGDDLERAVDVITSDRNRWVDTMLREELGLPAAQVSPSRAALATFTAFVVAGIVPLLAFVYELWVGPLRIDAFKASALMTASVFFGIGTLKSRFVNQPWYRGGLEVLAIGGGAALLAFLFGVLLKDLRPLS